MNMSSSKIKNKKEKNINTFLTSCFLYYSNYIDKFCYTSHKNSKLTNNFYNLIYYSNIFIIDYSNIIYILKNELNNIEDVAIAFYSFIIKQLHTNSQIIIICKKTYIQTVDYSINIILEIGKALTNKQIPLDVYKKEQLCIYEIDFNLQIKVSTGIISSIDDILFHFIGVVLFIFINNYNIKPQSLTNMNLKIKKKIITENINITDDLFDLINTTSNNSSNNNSSSNNSSNNNSSSNNSSNNNSSSNNSSNNSNNNSSNNSIDIDTYTDTKTNRNFNKNVDTYTNTNLDIDTTNISNKNKLPKLIFVTNDKQYFNKNLFGKSLAETNNKINYKTDITVSHIIQTKHIIISQEQENVRTFLDCMVNTDVQNTNHLDCDIRTLYSIMKPIMKQEKEKNKSFFTYKQWNNQLKKNKHSFKCKTKRLKKNRLLSHKLFLYSLIKLIQEHQSKTKDWYHSMSFNEIYDLFNI